MALGSRLELLERERDVAALEEAVERGREGDGQVISIAGPAGIGKTRLIEELRAKARSAGMTVLAARGSEAERELGFGMARQLFEPAVARADERRREELLAGAAALAAPMLGLPRIGPGSIIEPAFAARHGLYWLAVNLAMQSPLVLTVDDAHWADTDSLLWLDYLAGRIEGLPLLLVLALRDEPPDAEMTLLHAPSTAVLRPRPLSEQAVRPLVAAALDEEPADGFVAACHTATGGNPFLLRELLAALAYEGVRPTEDAAGPVAQMAPPSIARSVLARLSRLGPAATGLAQAVTVLGERAALRHAAAVARLSVPDAAAAADALGRVDILQRSHPLEFVHPIVRTAIYADLAPAARAASHARAVDVLVEEGAAPVSVAAQLLLTEPTGDATVVEALRAAARDALAQGSPQPAATFLRRAIEEPPPLDSRPGVLRELGWAAAQAGDLAAASRHLAAAIELMEKASDRAGATRELAQLCLLAGRAVQAVDLLDRAIAGLDASEADLGVQLEADLARAAQFSLQARDMAADRAPRFRPRAGPLDRRGLAHEAMQEVMTGRADVAANSARHALEEGRLLAEESAESQTFYMAANALALAGDLEAAAETYGAALADARARGSARAFAMASCYRAAVQYVRGRVADAEADARAAISGHPAGLGVLEPVAVAFLVASLIERGRRDAAEGAIAEYPLDERAREPLFFNHYVAAAARLALARRDLGAAERLLLDCGRREQAWGVTTPALTQWRALLVPVLQGTGRSDEARRTAAEELQRARAFGSPHHLGVALRAAAFVDEGEARVARLHEAVATLAASPARLEHARALVDLGATLRHRGKRAQARDPLRLGLEEARRCGGLALAERAFQELAATGLRIRKIVSAGVDELTASERRVAQLAADGLSNREIAQALFITVRTVETHLRYAYRKLDIRGRAELADALRGGPAAGAQPDQPP